MEVDRSQKQTNSRGIKMEKLQLQTDRQTDEQTEGDTYTMTEKLNNRRSKTKSMGDSQTAIFPLSLYLSFFLCNSYSLLLALSLFLSLPLSVT